MSTKKSPDGRSPAVESVEGSSVSAVKGGKRKARSGNKPPNAGRAPRNRETGEWAGPGSVHPERRCKGTARRTGEQCKKAAIPGGSLCPSHGGGLPTVKKAAKERLLELVDPALAALHRVLTDDDADDSVKVRAALGILDRTGHGPNSKLELEVGLTKFQEAMVTGFGGEVVDGQAVWPEHALRGGVDRSEMDGPDEHDPKQLPTKHPALGRGVGADEPWEDVDQAQHDAQVEAWREFDEEDEAAYTSRIESTGLVVRGEVVPPVVRPNSARPDRDPMDPPDYDRR